MAGYSTINAQFRPMSYQEMLAPVVAADTEHKAIEEQQEQLKTLSSQWEQKLAGEKDDTLRDIYKGYIDEINKQSDQLSSQGLTPGARKGLYNLKAQYVQKIVPIEEAYKKFQEELDTRKKLHQQDSSRIFEDGDLSITSFYNNPNQQFKSLSGNEVYQMAAKDFENMSKRIVEGKNWQSTASGRYMQRLKTSGYTPEEIAHLVAQDEQAPAELKNLYNNILQSYTSRGDWGAAGNESIRQAVNRGASYAIGNTQWEVQTDPNFMNPLERLKYNAAMTPPVEPPLPWEHGQTNVDATKSQEIEGFNKEIAFLKELQGQKDLSSYLKKQPTKRETYVTSTGGISYRNVPGDDFGKQFKDLQKKYGSKNPTELIQKINKEIAKTSSAYRVSSFKTPSIERLSNKIINNYNAIKDLGDNQKLITFTDGSKPNEEELKTMFNGKATFNTDAKTGKIVYVSNDPTIKPMYVDYALLPTDINVGYEGNKPINAREYLQRYDKAFMENPSDVELEKYKTPFFNALTEYNNTFVPEPSTTSSKVVNPAGANYLWNQ